jgi:transposase
MSSTFPEVGGYGTFRQDFERSGYGSERAGQDRCEGMFYRRKFCFGKKRGPGVGKTKRGKGTKIMGIADTSGLPVALCTGSASPHEITYVEPTLKGMFVKERPHILIGDKAYDSDKLDRQLANNYTIELIAPHRANRSKPKTQDGRKLRRYRKRWKVERLFAWLQNFRRIQTRWEYYLSNFHGFVQLGCIMILLRYF